MGRKQQPKTPGSSPESAIEIRVQPRSPQDNLNDVNQHQNQIRPSQFNRPPLPPPRSRPQPDRLFRSWLPWMVPVVAIVNIVLFVYVMYVNDCPRNSENCIGAPILHRYAFQSTKENPLLGPSALTLLKMGALDVKRVVERHQVWRLATCMWLHAGVFHVLANMLSLLFVGIRLEQEFGFVRIGLVYVISGIGGSLSSSLFVRNTISVGASGALFGLLGAMLSELLTNWTIYENKMAALSTLVLIITINLAVGILPHVDNFAHLGGFLTGFLIGFVVLVRPQYGWVNQKNAPPGYYVGAAKYSKYKVYQYIFLFLALIILTAGFATGLVMLISGVDGNDHCPWCHYLSCIPTPLWTCEARCTSSQLENQLNLTCMSNHKYGFYILQDGNDTLPEIQRLCTELCS